jgi:DNA-directed RNA polymerase subunit RPC12/RpoP
MIERLCIGYEEHACGKPFTTQGTNSFRCPECQKEHSRRRNLVKAKERYARDMATSSRQKFIDRLPRAFCAHTLQRLSGWRFVCAINSILADEVKYVRSSL